jgi:predicted flap endonuclease-1-like 5' DNA nuclease
VGFFLSKTWLFWLLAALLAALIAWLLCNWWARRRAGLATGLASHELTTAQALLRTRESELERVATERNSHLVELGALRPKAAAHDDLVTELAGLREGTVPKAEHQDRVDQLNGQVSSLTGRIQELKAQGGEVDALHGRIAELQPRADQVPGLELRIHELEGRANQVGVLQGRIHELEGEAGQVQGLQGRIRELEAEQSQRNSATPDVGEGARALGFAVAMDDLTVVEGIGPKIAGLCNDAGIHTWRELARTPVSRLREILEAAGPRYQIHDPGTWPKQAALLADGHWEPFKSLTDQLKGGRAAE